MEFCHNCEKEMSPTHLCHDDLDDEKIYGAYGPVLRSRCLHVQLFHQNSLGAWADGKNNAHSYHNVNPGAYLRVDSHHDASSNGALWQDSAISRLVHA